MMTTSLWVCTSLGAILALKWHFLSLINLGVVEGFSIEVLNLLNVGNIHPKFTTNRHHHHLHRQNYPPHQRHHSTSIIASSLTSALETLANERSKHVPEYKQLQWFDPKIKWDNEDAVSATSNIENNNNNTKVLSLPLYPLSAVYLPAGTDINHTLINVEPRNVQMAKDLMKLREKGEEPLFCVTLATLDTGLLAPVGTIMKMVDLNDNNNNNNNSVPQIKADRIVVTCAALETVDIVQIENTNAASWDSRIRKSSEYLRAQVQPRRSIIEAPIVPSSNTFRLLHQLLEDYNTVRSLYIQQNSVAANEIPPFVSKDSMEENLPLFSPTELTTSKGLWKFASTWQALCYTVRESRQIKLCIDRNELLIEAAIRLGGALQLPVHVEDVPPPDRKAVEYLQLRAQKEWLDLNLDPCLDFQVLLASTSHADRLKFLGSLVSKELMRLEEIQRRTALLPHELELQTSIYNETKPPGAWFNDELW